MNPVDSAAPEADKSSPAAPRTHVVLLSCDGLNQRYQGSRLREYLQARVSNRVAEDKAAPLVRELFFVAGSEPQIPAGVPVIHNIPGMARPRIHAAKHVGCSQARCDGLFRKPRRAIGASIC